MTEEAAAAVVAAAARLMTEKPAAQACLETLAATAGQAGPNRSWEEQKRVATALISVAMAEQER